MYGQNWTAGFGNGWHATPIAHPDNEAYMLGYSVGFTSWLDKYGDLEVVA